MTVGSVYVVLSSASHLCIRLLSLPPFKVSTLGGSRNSRAVAGFTFCFSCLQSSNSVSMFFSIIFQFQLSSLVLRYGALNGPVSGTSILVFHFCTALNAIQGLEQPLVVLS